MNKKLFLNLGRAGLGLLAGMVVFSGAAQAQSVRLLGDFRDWSAYSTSQGVGKLCFVLSKPQDVRPTPDDYSQSYLYLTHRPGESVRNELNFVAGFALAANSPTTVSIDGRSFILFAEADAAWLDDPSLSNDVAGNMRAGSTLTVQGSTADGVKVVQTFSLSGVTAASRAIDRECS